MESVAIKVHRHDGTGIAGVPVYAFTESGTYLYINGSTDSEGLVHFDLAAGIVKFRGDYQGKQFWSGNISVPETTEADIQTHEAEVTVRLSSPEIAVPIYVYSGTGTYLGINGTSDINGEVAFNLSNGEYSFRGDYQGSQYFSEAVVLDTPPNRPAYVEIPIGSSQIIAMATDHLGSPVEGVMVFVFTYPEGIYFGENGPTGADGSVSFELSAGEYHFRGDYQGKQYWSTSFSSPRIDPVTLPTGQRPCTVSLSNAIEGVPVYVFSDAGQYLNISGVTDNTGKVVFNLADGAVKFRANYQAYEYWSAVYNTSEQTSAYIDLNASMVSVQVRAHDGMGIENVPVYAFTPSGTYFNVNGVTDATGSVSLLLGGGDYRFRADYLLKQYWSSDISAPYGQSVFIDTGRRSVTVQLSEQLSGVPVYAFTDSGTYTNYSVQTTEGTATFELSDGPYKFRADYLHGQYWSNVITSPATNSAFIELSVSTIPIRVAALNGDGIADVQVFAFRYPNTYISLNANSNEMGEVSFSLPLGEYSFRADYQGKQFWKTQVSAPLSVPGEIQVIETGQRPVTVRLLPPFVGVPMFVFKAPSSYLSIQQQSGADGQTTFNLSDGEYRIRADYDGVQYWSEAFDSATAEQPVILNTGLGECVQDSDCPDDGNSCTVAQCVDASCVNTNALDGTLCDDGDACNGVSTCVSGSCTETTTPVTCVAQDECHVAGVCNPSDGSCSNPVGHEGEVCQDDGDACNGVSTCVGGACVETTEAVTCVAQDECHVAGVCNPTDGSCSNPVGHEGEVCQDDGDACNGVSTCVGGACVETTEAVTCVAQDECHVAGVCDSNTGVCSNPAGNDGFPCDDNNQCTTGDTCQSGLCSGSEISCDDGNVCTDDSCDPVTGCTYSNNNNSCDDSNACTENDVCENGFCEGTIISCDDGNVCTQDACDVLSGCSNIAISGTGCEDGIDCTVGDTCLNGVCKGNPDNTLCNDQNDSTNDICDPNIGCTHIADTSEVLQISISSPDNGSTIGSDSVVIRGTVAPVSDVQSVILYAPQPYVATITDGVYFVALDNLSDGQHNLQVVATDTENRTATAFITITVDTTPPVVIVTKPEFETTVTSPAAVLTASYAIEGSVVDAHFSSLRIRKEDDAWRSVSVLGSSFYAWVELSSGLNHFSLSATDIMGHETVSDVFLELPDSSVCPVSVEILNGQEIVSEPDLLIQIVTDKTADVMVTVNGSAASLGADNVWGANVTLGLGINTIVAQAVSGGIICGQDSKTIVYEDPAVTPLRVVDAAPLNGSTSVDVSAPIAVTFDHEIDPASIQGNVRLTVGGASIPGSIDVTPVPKIIIMSPDGVLPYNSPVEVSVIGGSAGITAYNGKTLESDYVFGFHTEMPPTTFGGLVYQLDGRPFANVEVVLVDQKRKTMTDTYGRFVFEDVPPGLQYVEFIADRESRYFPKRKLQVMVEEHKHNVLPRSLILAPADDMATSFFSGSDNEDQKLDFQDMIPGFSLTLKSKSIIMPDGADSGWLYLSPLYPDAVPYSSPLPIPLMGVYQITPSNVKVTRAYDVTFPNHFHLDVGRMIFIVAYSPDDNQMVGVGAGEVAEDGLTIRSIGGVAPTVLDFIAYVPVPEELEDQLRSSLQSIEEPPEDTVDGDVDADEEATAARSSMIHQLLWAMYSYIVDDAHAFGASLACYSGEPVCDAYNQSIAHSSVSAHQPVLVRVYTSRSASIDKNSLPPDWLTEDLMDCSNADPTNVEGFEGHCACWGRVSVESDGSVEMCRDPRCPWDLGHCDYIDEGTTIQFTAQPVPNAEVSLISNRVYDSGCLTTERGSCSIPDVYTSSTSAPGMLSVNVPVNVREQGLSSLQPVSLYVRGYFDSLIHPDSRDAHVAISNVAVSTNVIAGWIAFRVREMPPEQWDKCKTEYEGELPLVNNYYAKMVPDPTPGDDTGNTEDTDTEWLECATSLLKISEAAVKNTEIYVYNLTSGGNAVRKDSGRMMPMAVGKVRPKIMTSAEGGATGWDALVNSGWAGFYKIVTYDYYGDPDGAGLDSTETTSSLYGDLEETLGDDSSRSTYFKIIDNFLKRTNPVNNVNDDSDGDVDVLDSDVDDVDDEAIEVRTRKRDMLESGDRLMIVAVNRNTGYSAARIKRVGHYRVPEEDKNDIVLENDDDAELDSSFYHMPLGVSANIVMHPPELQVSIERKYQLQGRGYGTNEYRCCDQNADEKSPGRTCLPDEPASDDLSQKKCSFSLVRNEGVTNINDPGLHVFSHWKIPIIDTSGNRVCLKDGVLRTIDNETVNYGQGDVNLKIDIAPHQLWISSLPGSGEMNVAEAYIKPGKGLQSIKEISEEKDKDPVWYFIQTVGGSGYRLEEGDTPLVDGNDIEDPVLATPRRNRIPIATVSCYSDFEDKERWAPEGDGDVDLEIAENDIDDDEEEYGEDVPACIRLRQDKYRGFWTQSEGDGNNQEQVRYYCEALPCGMIDERAEHVCRMNTGEEDPYCWVCYNRHITWRAMKSPLDDIIVGRGDEDAENIDTETDDDVDYEAVSLIDREEDEPWPGDFASYEWLVAIFGNEDAGSSGSDGFYNDEGVLSGDLLWGAEGTEWGTDATDLNTLIVSLEDASRVYGEMECRLLETGELDCRQVIEGALAERCYNENITGEDGVTTTERWCRFSFNDFGTIIPEIDGWLEVKIFLKADPANPIWRFRVYSPITIRTFHVTVASNTSIESSGMPDYKLEEVTPKYEGKSGAAMPVTLPRESSNMGLPVVLELQKMAEGTIKIPEGTTPSVLVYAQNRGMGSQLNAYYPSDTYSCTQDLISAASSGNSSNIDSCMFSDSGEAISSTKPTGNFGMRYDLALQSEGDDPEDKYWQISDGRWGDHPDDSFKQVSSLAMQSRLGSYVAGATAAHIALGYDSTSDSCEDGFVLLDYTDSSESQRTFCYSAHDAVNITPVGELDLGVCSTPGKCDQGINLNNSNLVLGPYTDISHDGNVAYAITRTFNSLDTTTNGPMGRGWTVNAIRHLDLADYDDAHALERRLVWTREDGHKVIFNLDSNFESSNSLTPDDGNPAPWAGRKYYPRESGSMLEMYTSDNASGVERAFVVYDPSSGYAEIYEGDVAPFRLMKIVYAFDNQQDIEFTYINSEKAPADDTSADWTWGDYFGERELDPESLRVDTISLGSFIPDWTFTYNSTTGLVEGLSAGGTPVANYIYNQDNELVTVSYTGAYSWAFDYKSDGTHLVETIKLEADATVAWRENIIYADDGSGRVKSRQVPGAHRQAQPTGEGQSWKSLMNVIQLPESNTVTRNVSFDGGDQSYTYRMNEQSGLPQGVAGIPARSSSMAGISFEHAVVRDDGVSASGCTSLPGTPEEEQLNRSCGTVPTSLKITGQDGVSYGYSYMTQGSRSQRQLVTEVKASDGSYTLTNNHDNTSMSALGLSLDFFKLSAGAGGSSTVATGRSRTATYTSLNDTKYGGHSVDYGDGLQYSVNYSGSIGYTGSKFQGTISLPGPDVLINRDTNGLLTGTTVVGTQNQVTYAYNGDNLATLMGKPSSVETSNGSSTAYGYTSGMLSSSTASYLKVDLTTTDYDVLERPTSIHNINGGDRTTIEYPSYGYGIGSTSFMTVSNSSYPWKGGTYIYNELQEGNLISFERTEEDDYSFNYTYDYYSSTGRLSTISREGTVVYSALYSTNYSGGDGGGEGVVLRREDELGIHTIYDYYNDDGANAGKVRAIAVGVASYGQINDAPMSVEFTYDGASGLLDSITSPQGSGHRVDYDYDAMNRLTKIAPTDLSAIEYTYKTDTQGDTSYVATSTEGGYEQTYSYEDSSDWVLTGITYTGPGSSPWTTNISYEGSPGDEANYRQPIQVVFTAGSLMNTIDTKRSADVSDASYNVKNVDGIDISGDWPIDFDSASSDEPAIGWLFESSGSGSSTLMGVGMESMTPVAFGEGNVDDVPTSDIGYTRNGTNKLYVNSVEVNSLNGVQWPMAVGNAFTGAGPEGTLFHPAAGGLQGYETPSGLNVAITHGSRGANEPPELVKGIGAPGVFTQATTYGSVCVEFDHCNGVPGQFAASDTLTYGDTSPDEWGYQYDPAGRLIKAQLGTDAIEYIYDGDGGLKEVSCSSCSDGPLGNAVGSRTTYHRAPQGYKTGMRVGTTDRVSQDDYDDTGRLKNWTPGQNTTTGVPLDLSYDTRGRLQTVSTAGDDTTIARYDYNASGWRLSKRRMLENNQWEMTRFVYSGTNLAAERIVRGTGSSENGNVSMWSAEERRYLWLGLRPVAMLRQECTVTNNAIDTCGDWEYYDIVSNRIGAPVSVVKSDGTVVWQARYTPYGITYMLNEDVDGDGTALVFNLRLPGQYFDSETGFNYNGHRYYIPELRRYNRPEPIGQAGSLDLYMYAGGNPVNRIDVDGLADYDSLYIDGIPRDKKQVEDKVDQSKKVINGVKPAAEMAPGAGLVEAGVEAEKGNYGKAAFIAATEFTPGKYGRKLYKAGKKLVPLAAKVGKKAPKHHIATNKNFKSPVRGGPWSPRFKRLFDKAGLDLDDAINKIRVPGHKGPHPQEYHERIYDRLDKATDGLEGDAYRKALEDELEQIKKDVITPGHPLNKMLRKEK